MTRIADGVYGARPPYGKREACHKLRADELGESITIAGTMYDSTEKSGASHYKTARYYLP